MIGTLIGAGLGVASSIYGGIKARNAANKAQRELDKQQADNQAWYDRRYNEDATQRAEVRRMLTMTMDRMRRRNNAAAGTAAVMGTSSEGVAAMQQSNAAALGDATAQIAANNEARKDQLENSYIARKNELSGQKIAGQQQQAANTAAATAAAGQALASAGASVDELGEAKKSRGLFEKFLGKNPQDKLYEA